MKHVYIVYEEYTPPGWRCDNNDVTTTLVGAFTTREYAQALVDFYGLIDRDLEIDEVYEYTIYEQPLDAHPPTVS